MHEITDALRAFYDSIYYILFPYMKHVNNIDHHSTTRIINKFDDGYDEFAERLEHLLEKKGLNNE